MATSPDSTALHPGYRFATTSPRFAYGKKCTEPDCRKQRQKIQINDHPAQRACGGIFHRNPT